ncbi:MAG: hypothetical protein JWR90_1963 [Marmoricola sp.]|nr:hypothetical protein [Marmoricola sp.]
MALACVGVLDGTGLPTSASWMPLPVAVPPSPKLQVTLVGVHTRGMVTPTTVTEEFTVGAVAQ